MQLEKVSNHPPVGAEQLLLELGNNVRGFCAGTSLRAGTPTLQQTLEALQDCADPAKLSPGFVPQTVFWMMDDLQHVVGITLVRHELNARLIQTGGHIGYYVKASERNKGYATAAVPSAMEFLKSKGIHRALITTRPANIASAKVAIANGGVLDVPGVHPDTGEPTVRYWIEA